MRSRVMVLVVGLVAQSGCVEPESPKPRESSAEDTGAVVDSGSGTQRCYLDYDDDGELSDEPYWIESDDSDCEDPGEGTAEDPTSDCDDANGAIHSRAVELCDGQDNDCDGETDEDDAVDAVTWHIDYDGDGHGAPEGAYTVVACEAPDGYVASDADCDDSDPLFHPGADEACEDPTDYNCDGSVAYADLDGDGFAACEDCDDGDAYVSPAGDERCDELDNDCDGETDEDEAVDAATWFADQDGDGFGDAGETLVSCVQPDGYTDDQTDCDDDDDDDHPGADERCDGADNDCDATVDEDAEDAATWYLDADGDSFGDASSTSTSCSEPSGYVATGSDCDDSDAGVSPAGEERCDELDNDCDGETDEVGAMDAAIWYLDHDEDGFGSAVYTQVACDQPDGYVARDTDADFDCDDLDAEVSPDAEEVCDGVDNDCDDQVDGVPAGYDAFEDLELASNPSGAWSYGWSEAVDGLVTRYDTYDDTTEEGLVYWYASSAQAPSLAYNTTGAVLLSDDIEVPANELVFHPGAYGQFSHVVWTAPHDGDCTIAASLRAIDTGITDIYLVHAGSVVSDGALVGKGANGYFNASLSVVEGDTISVAVGYGADEVYYNDSTSLSLAIDCTFTCAATP